MTKAEAWNCPFNGDITRSDNMCAFKLTFSPADPLSTDPDIEYMFGTYNLFKTYQSVTFTSEVVETTIIINNSPDIEGIFFKDESGTVQRVGEDEWRTTRILDYT